MFMSNYSTEQLEMLVDEEVITDQHGLIVFNDEVNTFDFVINTLMNICGHTAEQAEQCTMLIHYKGKCCVKNGSYETLEPLCTKILDKGLSASIA